MTPDQHIEDYIATLRIKAELAIASLVCVLLIASTFRFEFQIASEAIPWLSRLQSQFHLGYENNFAAWFSGVLLALIALHALDGRTLYRSVAPHVSRAWATIAAIMLFLSADEVGSLHERLTGLGKAAGIGIWGFLIPIGMGCAFFLLRAVVTLWKTGGTQRRQALLLLTGFVLLGSVAVQEFIEHAFSWDTPRARAARLTIEEGSELIGMLILLLAALGNTIGLVHARPASRGKIFEVFSKHGLDLLMVLAVVTPILVLFTVSLEDQRGRPADWLAAMAFLAAAAVVFGQWLEGENTFASLAMMGMLLLLSCTCLAIQPERSLEIMGLTILERAALLTVFSIPIFAICIWSQTFHKSPAKLVVVMSICLALLTLPDSRSMVFLLTIMLGASVYWTVLPDLGTRHSTSRKRLILE